MMSDYLKTPIEVLVSLINTDNGTVLRAEDCMFSVPQAALGTQHGRNTAIYVSLASRPSDPPVCLTYRRLDINKAIAADASMDFMQGGAEYVSELMEQINARFQINLGDTDYIDRALEETITAEPIALVIEISPNSLLFTGPLRILLLTAEVVTPLPFLSQAIVVTQLGGLSGLLDTPEQVLTRAVNLVNDVNFDDIDLRFGLVSSTGLDASIGIRAGANSGYTGAVNVSYSKANLEVISQAHSSLFLLDNQTTKVQLLPMLKNRWSARVGDADILDGVLSGFVFPLEAESNAIVIEADPQSKIYTGTTTVVVKRREIPISSLSVQILGTLEVLDLVASPNTQDAVLARANRLNTSDLRSAMLDANYHRLSADLIAGNECEITFSVKMGLPSYSPDTGAGTAFSGSAGFRYGRLAVETLVASSRMATASKDNMLTTHDYAARVLAKLGIPFEPADWLLVELPQPDPITHGMIFELVASSESLTYQGSAGGDLYFA